jgi:Fe-S oxidoreductase
MKARFYEQSLKISDPLVRAVRELEPDHVASDCPLAAQRIAQETGRRVVHPIVLLRRAYGLPEPA